MNRGLQMLLTGAAAALPLVLADRLLQPLPIPAATAASGGLVGMWIGPGPTWSWMAAGAAAGLALGFTLHGWSHWAGRSTRPPEGLTAHLASDGAIGLAIALLALGAALAVRWWLGRREG